MLRLFFLSASFGLALLAFGVCPTGVADDRPKADPKEETNPALVVNLRISGEAKYADIRKLLEALKAQGATKLSLRTSDAKEGSSAELRAEALTPSKRVAAVVKELLDGGITKVSIEVKK